MYTRRPNTPQVTGCAAVYHYEYYHAPVWDVRDMTTYPLTNHALVGIVKVLRMPHTQSSNVIAGLLGSKIRGFLDIFTFFLL